MTDIAQRPHDPIVAPVGDWQTDFDHAHPSYNANIYEIWDELRELAPFIKLLGSYPAAAH